MHMTTTAMVDNGNGVIVDGFDWSLTKPIK